MIEHGLPWLLSAITIYMTVLAGNKAPHAWAIGLGNQALWLFWIVSTASWGFLPMNLALWIVYGRNHFKWNGTPEWVRGAAGKARELALGVAPARAQRQANLAPTPSQNEAMGDLTGDPAAKPIEVSPTPPKNPIRAGEAVKNIFAFFVGLIAWAAKNPIAVLALAVLALWLTVGASCSGPFGKSKDALRLEREIAQREAQFQETLRERDEAITAIRTETARTLQQIRLESQRGHDAIAAATPEHEEEIDPALVAAFRDALDGLCVPRADGTRSDTCGP